MENKNILIIEDDMHIRNYISYILKQENYSFLTASNASNALNQLVTNNIDLILLDLGLPDYDGIEVLKKVREWSEVPIIILSARDQDKEKVNAFECGADDYIVKPFSAVELIARIKVSLRHYNKALSTLENITASVGDLMIDYSKHCVTLNEEIVHLTPLEYNLLCLLFKNMGKLVTKEIILKEIYGQSYGNDTQALRALMAGLRRKIEISPAKPRYILTEIGVGYRLADE